MPEGGTPAPARLIPAVVRRPSGRHYGSREAVETARRPVTGPSESTVEDLVQRIGDGCLLALPKPEAGASMAAIRALVRRGAKQLRLWCLPSAGLQADLLIGAGCVASIECSGVSLGEFGAAPRFRRAAESGTVRIVDSTCQAMYAAVQAGEKGMPFVGLRGIVGSDVLTHRDDWQTMQNPFASDEDPVVVLPAVRPDIALDPRTGFETLSAISGSGTPARRSCWRTPRKARSRPSKNTTTAICSTTSA